MRSGEGRRRRFADRCWRDPRDVAARRGGGRRGRRGEVEGVARPEARDRTRPGAPRSSSRSVGDAWSTFAGKHGSARVGYKLAAARWGPARPLDGGSGAVGGDIEGTNGSPAARVWVRFAVVARAPQETLESGPEARGRERWWNLGSAVPGCSPALGPCSVPKDRAQEPGVNAELCPPAYGSFVKREPTARSMGRGPGGCQPRLSRKRDQAPGEGSRATNFASNGQGRGDARGPARSDRRLHALVLICGPCAKTPMKHCQRGDRGLLIRGIAPWPLVDLSRGPGPRPGPPECAASPGAATRRCDGRPRPGR